MPDQKTAGAQLSYKPTERCRQPDLLVFILMANQVILSAFHANVKVLVCVPLLTYRAAIICHHAQKTPKCRNVSITCLKLLHSTQMQDQRRPSWPS